MAKLPLQKALTRQIQKALIKAAQDNVPEGAAIKAAAHGAAVWLDRSVLRFKQNTPQGIALEAGSDWLLYSVVEPALVKLAEGVAEDVAKGEDGKAWAKARTALATLKAKAQAKRASKASK